MVIQVSDGKYLHTAYAVSNIAEEFETDDWSLISQTGMSYVGTYIDDSVIDSPDPTAYSWEELVDTDVDDLDEDGEMPVADFQAQIDALSDQVDVLQTDTESLQSSIDVSDENITGATELASEANDIANATRQYFWNDESGVHVSDGEGNPEGDRNLILNTIGMLFRKGLTNLLAILAGGATGEEARGLAVYDGNGNNDENVVASFTNEGADIGKADEGQVRIRKNDIKMTDSTGATEFWLTQDEATETTTATDKMGLNPPVEPGVIVPATRLPYDLTASKQITNPYVSDMSVTVAGKVGRWENLGIRDYTYTVTQSIGSFGDFSLPLTILGCTLTGSIVFNGSDTITVNVTTVGTPNLNNVMFIDCYAELSYTTYLTTPFLAIGKFADARNKKDKAFVIGKKTSNGNVFEVDRNGAVSMFTDTASAGSTFRVTHETTQRPTSAGVYVSETYPHNLDGYFPLCCVGYRFEGTHSTLQNVYRVQLTDVWEGHASVTLGTRDTATSGEGEYTVHTWVLWAKVRSL